MEMVELIVGAAVGAVGGYMAKDKLSGTSNEVFKLQNELHSLSDENEKLRKRSEEAERQVEDLLAENQKLRRSAKDQEDNSDDIEDELYTAKAKIKKLTQQNDELLCKLQEYKELCASYKNELDKQK